MEYTAFAIDAFRHLAWDLSQLMTSVCKTLDPDSYQAHNKNKPLRFWQKGFKQAAYQINLASAMHTTQPNAITKATKIHKDAQKLWQQLTTDTTTLQEFRLAVESTINHLTLPLETTELLIQLIANNLALKLALFEASYFSLSPKALDIHHQFTNFKQQTFTVFVPSGSIEGPEEKRWEAVSLMVENFTFACTHALSKEQDCQLLSDDPFDNIEGNQRIEFSLNQAVQPCYPNFPLPVTNMSLAQKLYTLIEDKPFLLLQDEMPLYLLVSKNDRTKKQAVTILKNALKKYQQFSRANILHLDPDEQEWLEEFEERWIESDIKTVTAVPYYISRRDIAQSRRQHEFPQDAKLFEQVIDPSFEQNDGIKKCHTDFPQYIFYIDPIDKIHKKWHSFEFWSVIIDLEENYPFEPLLISQD